MLYQSALSYKMQKVLLMLPRFSRHNYQSSLPPTYVMDYRTQRTLTTNVPNIASDGYVRIGYGGITGCAPRCPSRCIQVRVVAHGPPPSSRFPVSGGSRRRFFGFERISCHGESPLSGVTSGVSPLSSSPALRTQTSLNRSTRVIVSRKFKRPLSRSDFVVRSKYKGGSHDDSSDRSVVAYLGAPLLSSTHRTQTSLNHRGSRVTEIRTLAFLQ